MDQKEVKVGTPAGFLVRAAARFLDGLILVLMILFLTIVMAIALHNREMMVPVIYGLLLLVPCLYFTLTTALWGQTTGKKIFNLKVMRTDDHPVSFPRSFWRWVSYFFSAIPLGLGYILAAILPDKRGLHDLTSGTKVVHIGPYNENIMALILILPFGSIPITGILAAIAIPRFAQMLEKSREGSTKGNLGTLKAAMSIYYGDHNGKWPKDLEKDLVPKYIDRIPSVKATGAFVAGGKSPAGNKITLASPGQAPRTSDDGWLYDSSVGSIYINSTVKDSKGIPYSFYGNE